MSYIEHQQSKLCKSHKQQLRKMIDNMIPYCKDLEDLLTKLENNGFEIKRGKYISIKG